MMDNNQKDVEKTSSEQQQEDLTMSSSEQPEVTANVSSGESGTGTKAASGSSSETTKASEPSSGEPVKASSESSGATAKASEPSSGEPVKASSESSSAAAKASEPSSGEPVKASSESSGESVKASSESAGESAADSSGQSNVASSSSEQAKTANTSAGQAKTAAGTTAKRTTARKTSTTQRTTSAQRNSSAQKTASQRTASSQANARKTTARGAAAKTSSKEDEEAQAIAQRIKKNSNDVKMTISGHLKELRNRVAICFIVLVVAFLIALYFSQPLINFLTDMGTKYDYVFVYISPQELLMEQFSISLVVALCVTLPLILYQVWAFVQPALKKRENTMFKVALISGLFCFVVGVLFAYFIMLPFMLQFLIGLSEGTNIQASISVQNYINFEITIFVVMGAVFEMPVLFVILTQVGLLKVEWLRKGFKYAVIVIFLIAALVTPPDIVSQSMVAIPMMGLYWLSILVSSLLLRFRKPKEEDDDDGDDDDDD